ncbi:hypothetical protein [Rariglobus hedericola]|uniref:Uncharacterized protein n=1 Tax=Rariglobus hedericola TaxID=2597822 RepID=A0A556QQR2_9BACT|nr:hypothetical protein [Rariglobus hedericola]TSJ78971.1 hypothetical protein FPL22_06625 [Rariglobus hedericola]
MIIHWLPLLCGLFFGLIPPRLLINSECRYLSCEGLWSRVVTREKSNQRRRRWWKLPIVWIDPVRGFVTAMLITTAFEVVDKPTALQKLAPVAATFLTLLVVLWIQCRGRNTDRETLSPSAFLAGLMLGMLPPVVALSAIVIGITTAIAMTSFMAGYVVATLTTAVIGYVFLGRSPWLAAYTILVASPLLINWLRRTQLVMPVRC